MLTTTLYDIISLSRVFSALVAKLYYHLFHRRKQISSPNIVIESFLLSLIAQYEVSTNCFYPRSLGYQADLLSLFTSRSTFITIDYLYHFIEHLTISLRVDVPLNTIQTNAATVTKVWVKVSTYFHVML